MEKTTFAQHMKPLWPKQMDADSEFMKKENERISELPTWDFINSWKKHWTPEFLYASPISILINRCALRHYQFIWYLYPVTFISLYSENVLHYWGLGIMRNFYLLEINFKHLQKYMLNNTFWQVIEILSK